MNTVIHLTTGATVSVKEEPDVIDVWYEEALSTSKPLRVTKGRGVRGTKIVLNPFEVVYFEVKERG